MTDRLHKFGPTDLTVTDRSGNDHNFEIDGGEISFDVDFEDMLNVGLDMEKVRFEDIKAFNMPLTWEGTATITKPLSPLLQKHFKTVTRKGIEYE